VRITGPPPVRRVPDPELEKGKTVVEEWGSPARATSVDRTVYDEQGAVLHDETWSTSYRGEYKVIRVGTKVPEPKPDEKPPPGEKPKPGTAPTDTAPPATTAPKTTRP
jgi:uncharacterized protein YabE (DUF348 family)